MVIGGVRMALEAVVAPRAAGRSECACAIIVSTIAYNARRDTGCLRLVGRDIVEEPSRCLRDPSMVLGRPRGVGSWTMVAAADFCCCHAV